MNEQMKKHRENRRLRLEFYQALLFFFGYEDRTEAGRE